MKFLKQQRNLKKKNPTQGREARQRSRQVTKKYIYEKQNTENKLQK